MSIEDDNGDSVDDVWRGEEHFITTGGVALAQDDQMVHFEDSVRDAYAYDLHISHGGGDVCVTTAYDDGSIDFGALVKLEPTEAQRLARMLMEAANYEAARPHADEDDRSRVETMKGVLFG